MICFGPSGVWIVNSCTPEPKSKSGPAFTGQLAAEGPEKQAVVQSSLVANLSAHTTDPSLMLSASTESTWLSGESPETV